MAKPSAKTANASDPLRQMHEIDAAFVKPFGAFGAVMFDAWLDLYEEWTEFMLRRLRKDVSTMRAMAHCQNPGELPKIQAEFVQTAVDEYQEEAGRVNTLLQEASRKFANGENRNTA